MQGHFQEAERFLFGESLTDSFSIKALDFASGSLVPRAFGLAGSDWVIENGCGRDIVHCDGAGLISIEEPAEDGFVLSAVFVHSRVQQIGESRLIEFMQQPAPQRLAGP